MRYDVDTNLRSNKFIASLLADPQFRGLGNLVTAPRGNDVNNLQPRFGFAWDTRSDARMVVRGGYGLYSGPNRPWFNIRGDVVSSQFTAEITDPSLLRNYPNQQAVLGGRSLEERTVPATVALPDCAHAKAGMTLRPVTMSARAQDGRTRVIMRLNSPPNASAARSGTDTAPDWPMR